MTSSPASPGGAVHRRQLSASELEGADRNLSIAHMLRSYGIIKDDAHDAVLSYTRSAPPW